MKNIKFLQISIFFGWTSGFAVHNPAEHYNRKPSQVWIAIHSDRHTFGSPYIRIDIHSDRPTFRYKAFILISCQHAFILRLPCLCFNHDECVVTYCLSKVKFVYLPHRYVIFSRHENTEGKEILSHLTRRIQNESKFLLTWPEHKECTHVFYNLEYSNKGILCDV